MYGFLFHPAILRPSLGFWGNRGIRPFISGEHGNKSLKLKGTGEQRQFGGTGNIEHQDFDSGEQGKMSFFSGAKENRYPSERASILCKGALQTNVCLIITKLVLCKRVFITQANNDPVISYANQQLR